MIFLDTHGSYGLNLNPYVSNFLSDSCTKIYMIAAYQYSSLNFHYDFSSTGFLSIGA